MSAETRATRTLGLVTAGVVLVGSIVAFVLGRSPGPSVSEADAAAGSARGGAAPVTDASPPAGGERPGASPSEPSPSEPAGVPTTAPSTLEPPGASPAPTAPASDPTPPAVPITPEPGTPASAELPEAERARGSLPADAIRSVVRDATPELRFCFEWQLTQHPELAGRLTMEFTIDETGAVRDAHVAEDLLADDTVTRCFTHVMSTLHFPPPDPPGDVLVRYPFALSGAPPARAPEGI